MKIRYLALVLTLAATPQALVAQDPSPTPQGRGPGMHMGRHGGEPFAHLLQRRQELNLTDAQVARIEAVRARLQAQNAPIREQMQALHREAGMPAMPEGRGGERPRMSEEQRTAMRQMHERMRPLMEQMRTNLRAAHTEVREVLTEQQRAQLRQGCHGEGMRGHGAGRPGAGHRGGGMMRGMMRPAS